MWPQRVRAYLVDVFWIVFFWLMGLIFILSFVPALDVLFYQREGFLLGGLGLLVISSALMAVNIKHAGASVGHRLAGFRYQETPGFLQAFGVQLLKWVPVFFLGYGGLLLWVADHLDRMGLGIFVLGLGILGVDWLSFRRRGVFFHHNCVGLVLVTDTPSPRESQLMRGMTYLMVLGFLALLIYPNVVSYHKHPHPLPSTRANMYTLQTAVETYAVDWGGLYPENVRVLYQEASQGSPTPYWKEFENPYTGSQGYQQAFADERDIAHLSKPGLVTYQVSADFVEYAIYGYDQEGKRLSHNNQDRFYSNMNHNY